MTRRPTAIARAGGRPDARPAGGRRRPAPRARPTAAGATGGPPKGQRATQATGRRREALRRGERQRCRRRPPSASPRRVRSRRRRRIGLSALAVGVLAGAGLGGAVLAAVRRCVGSRWPGRSGWTRRASARPRPPQIGRPAAAGRHRHGGRPGARAARWSRRVSVTRQWPSTLRDLGSRADAGGGRARAVQGCAWSIARASSSRSRAACHAGLPLLRVDLERAGPGALQAVPGGVRQRSRRPCARQFARSARTARTPSGWYCADGSRVVWGGADDSARKAEVLLRPCARRAKAGLGLRP